MDHWYPMRRVWGWGRAFTIQAQADTGLKRGSTRCWHRACQCATSVNSSPPTLMGAHQDGIRKCLIQIR